MKPVFLVLVYRLWRLRIENDKTLDRVARKLMSCSLHHHAERHRKTYKRR